MLSDREIKQLLTDIFDGVYSVDDLPTNLYLDIAEYLKKGLYEGFGGGLSDFDGKDLELLKEFRINIYHFSAAKTEAQVRELQELIFNDEGKAKGFREWFEEAKQSYNLYNVDHAQTEYNTCVASGQMGVRWGQIQKDADILPYLKLTVVEDSQTTDICQPLDGICLPVNDSFWHTYYPPNHWNCRSSVLQTDDKGELSSKSEVNHAKEHADEDMQDAFKMNVGKDGYVFSPEHPYFDVARNVRENNFGFEIPEED